MKSYIPKALLLAVSLAAIACDTPTSPKLEASFRIHVSGRQVTVTTTTVLEGDAEVTWNFGDGRGASGLSAVHTFATAGEYEITQTIRVGSRTAISSQSVTVEDPPTCKFSFKIASPTCAQFLNRSTARSFSAPGHSARWSFGDGFQSVDDEPLHCYQGDGQYEVELSVTNNGGTDSCSLVVSIGEGEPTAGTTSP